MHFFYPVQILPLPWFTGGHFSGFFWTTAVFLVMAQVSSVWRKKWFGVKRTTKNIWLFTRVIIILTETSRIQEKRNPNISVTCCTRYNAKVFFHSDAFLLFFPVVFGWVKRGDIFSHNRQKVRNLVCKCDFKRIGIF